MKFFRKTGKKMTIRAKINWLVLLDILIVVILIMTVFSLLFIKSQFDEIGQRALSVAQTVADLPEIREAFQGPDPSTIIQPLVENIRKQTGAEFIVVGNMDLIRYSHPNQTNIGKKMVGNDDEQVLQGHNSITQAVGTLGLSVRGKSPIFDLNHQQIGVISVGFLVEEIWEDIALYLLVFAGLGMVGLAIGLIGANILSGHVKKQILNMEPSEIAFLVQEQGAILESIREGVLSVDSSGKITACNQEAKRLLELESADSAVGKSIMEVVPNSRLPEVLAQGISHFDQPMVIGNTLVIVNRIPVLLNEKPIGAVASFRDKIQLDQIDQRLADVTRYVDALRSQRHEFMNHLHTISGLIAIEEYDHAKNLIKKVNNEQQRVLEFFMARIHDPAVIGILIGKLHRANELRIHFVIDAESHLSNPCPNRDLVVSILGNAIENSFEALAGWEAKNLDPTVTTYINDKNEYLFVRVSDTGPGVDPSLIGHIFEDGITTKGTGRGFGLSILYRRAANIGGKLAIQTSCEGTVLEAVLPK